MKTHASVLLELLLSDKGFAVPEKQGVAVAQLAVVYRGALQEEKRGDTKGACIHPRRHAG